MTPYPIKLKPIQKIRLEITIIKTKMACMCQRSPPRKLYLTYLNNRTQHRTWDSKLLTPSSLVQLHIDCKTNKPTRTQNKTWFKLFILLPCINPSLIFYLLTIGWSWNIDYRNPRCTRRYLDSSRVLFRSFRYKFGKLNHLSVNSMEHEFEEVKSVVWPCIPWIIRRMSNMGYL